MVQNSEVETDYTSSYTPFLVKKPKWDAEGIPGYQSETSKLLKNLLQEFNQAEFIPLLSELFSKMLVISAKTNFETTSPSNKKKRKLQTFFSAEHRKAYEEHEHVCNQWRKQGRPLDSSHPAKMLKLESQRKLQRLAREGATIKAHTNHNELMATFNQNVSQVYAKLKKMRGEASKRVNISQIETLNGTYSGDNVLEGFCSNTESLCTDESDGSDHGFYQMCLEDNMMIFQITQDEDIKIPHMTLQNLKDILFKKLKLNKACDVYKLSVEHLRYAGDETLSLVLCLLNMIIDNINYLSSTQLNTSVASIIYKSKSKPVHHHKSYR